jgi:hypothetical protein
MIMMMVMPSPAAPMMVAWVRISLKLLSGEEVVEGAFPPGEQAEDDDHERQPQVRACILQLAGEIIPWIAALHTRRRESHRFLFTDVVHRVLGRQHPSHHHSE